MTGEQPLPEDKRIDSGLQHKAAVELPAVKINRTPVETVDSFTYLSHSIMQDRS